MAEKKDSFEAQLENLPGGVILFRLPAASRRKGSKGNWCAAMAADGSITQADGSMIREEFSTSFQAATPAAAVEGLLEQLASN